MGKAVFCKVLLLPHKLVGRICPEQNPPAPSPVPLTKGLVQGLARGSSVTEEVSDRMAEGQTSCSNCFVWPRVIKVLN